MIDYITGSEVGIIDTHIYNPAPCYTSGAVYWDGNSQQFKVIDQNGISYVLKGAIANITTGYKQKEMLEWYEQKRQEEAQIQELCKKYPNLADAKREYDSLLNLLKNQ